MLLILVSKGWLVYPSTNGFDGGQEFSLLCISPIRLGYQPSSVSRNRWKNRGQKRLALVGCVHPFSNQDLASETQRARHRTPDTRLCPYLLRLKLRVLYLSIRVLFGGSNWFGSKPNGFHKSFLVQSSSSQRDQLNLGKKERSMKNFIWDRKLGCFTRNWKCIKRDRKTTSVWLRQPMGTRYEYAIKRMILDFLGSRLFVLDCFQQRYFCK